MKFQEFICFYRFTWNQLFVNLKPNKTSYFENFGASMSWNGNFYIEKNWFWRIGVLFQSSVTKLKKFKLISTYVLNFMTWNEFSPFFIMQWAHYPIIFSHIDSNFQRWAFFSLGLPYRHLLPASINQKGVFKRFLIEKCAAEVVAPLMPFVSQRNCPFFSHTCHYSGNDSGSTNFVAGAISFYYSFLSVCVYQMWLFVHFDHQIRWK